MALPRPLRLSRARAITEVFRRSVRRDTPFFTLRVHWRKTPPARALVVVPKKFSKRAVRRNAVRRRLTEWLRTEVPLKTGAFDCIVQVKPEAASATAREFTNELKRAFLALRITA